MSEELKPSAGVVLPDDRELLDFAVSEQFLLFCDEEEFLDIAKSVLSKFARLNPTDARLGELLERIVEHLEYDAIGSPSEVIAGDLAKELRALLAQSE